MTERDILIERLEQKLNAREKEMNEMKESLKESILKELREETNASTINRITRLERKVIDLNSAYEGVMKELLDQKSLLQMLQVKQAKPVKEESKPPKTEIKVRDVEKPADKPKPKGEYIVADNTRLPEKEKKSGEFIVAEDKLSKGVSRKMASARTERKEEGVEVIETPKRGQLRV